MRRRRSIKAEVNTSSKNFNKIADIAPACDAAHTNIIINSIIQRQQTSPKEKGRHATR